jgi:uncharacterized membrane protein YphA (DoxX/SURF4 family)
MAEESRFQRILCALFLRVPVSLIWIWGAFVNFGDIFSDPGGISGAAVRWRFMFEEVWERGVSLNLPSATPYAPSEIPANPFPWMGDLLQSYMAPNTELVITTMPVMELVIGLCLLVGFLARPAALGGIAANTMILLASGHTNPGIARVNLLMLLMEIGVLVTSAGRTFGVDSLLAEKVPRPPLRLW